MKNKIIIKILKLFGCEIFEKKGYLSVITKHSVKRSEQRISNFYLLRILADCALEHGERSVYFDYKKKQEGVFAKKFKGYIFVFNKDNTLLTLYRADNICDLLVTRK